MKSAVETLNPTRVKLTVEVPYEELAPSVDAAYKTISQQVQIPGFRKGKVPPRIIDQRVGRGAVLEEAVNDALPKFYAQALEESDVRPLGQPQVEVTDVPQGTSGDLKFTAEVDCRPEITLPDLDTLAVTVDDVEVSDDDIAQEVDALRERFGTLKPVERAAADGDFVTLDLTASIDGEEIDTVKGVSYQVGAKNMLEGMDEALTGLSAGETTTFDAPLAGGDRKGESAHVTLTLQAVKERELPPLDDDFAETATEFDTLEELRADLRTQLAQRKTFEQRLMEQLLDSVDIPVPDGVIADEVHRHLEGEGRLEDDEHRAEVDGEARQALRAQLLLDAIVEKEQVQVGQGELVEYLVQMSQQYGMAPQEFINAVGESGQLPAMLGEVARRKALATLLAKTTVTDASGNPVDLNALFGPVAGEGEADDEELLPADAPAAAAPSAADPSAVVLSDLGGFVEAEPTKD